MIERRKYARLNGEANVRYKIIGQRQKCAEPARCYNISPEGLCLMFKNEAYIKTGAKLDMEIAIKDCKPFRIIGEVIWIKGPGSSEESGNIGNLRAGIKILEIYNDDESRFLLQLCDRMVQKLNRDYPPAKS